MHTSLLAVAILLIAISIPSSDAGHDHAVDAISDIGYTNIVYTDNQPTCSGTLISRMWAITTCLCVQNIPAIRLYIRVGDPSLKSKTKHTFYKIENVDIHPECISKDNEYHVEHNIALLQLKEPVLDSLIVNIIKIPNQLMYWTPDSVLGLDLAVWIDMDDQATTLHKAVWHSNTTVEPNKNCEKHFGLKDFKPGQTTCAKYYHKGGKDDCKATLFVDDIPKCTVTLISKMWAITTCLCVKGITKNRVKIRIGDPSITVGKKHRDYAIRQTQLHPQCSIKGYHSEHDLAVIMLFEPFFDSRYVYIAKIPNQLTYWTPDSSLSLSLAAYSDLKDKASSLKDAVWHTNSLLLHPGICVRYFKSKYYKVGKNICASYFHTNGRNSCAIDIGAALSFDYTLIGILSFKENCGKGQGVGSYVNIPMHSQWIRNTVAQHTPWIRL